MSTPDPSPAPPASPARQSNKGRYLFVLILGLAIGIIATVMLLNAWRARQDPFPDALMHVQGWHIDQLKTNIEQNRCNPTDTLPHLQALRMTSNDLEAAFPGLRDDPRFQSAASAMRGAVDKVIAAPPLTCASAGAALKSIGDTCKGCHRDFRG